MKLKDSFVIYFSSLQEGKNQINFKIDDSFFKKFENEVEFSNSKLDLVLQLDKKATHIELFFKITGKVTLECDMSLELFDFDIKSEQKLIIKFSEEFNDDNEDIIELPRSKNDYKISQNIYEMVVLAVPSKKIHPKVLSGELKLDILEKLDKYLVNEIATDEESE